MEDTLTREQNWMKNNPITREGLQGRKEELQRMTESVLQKNADGSYVQPSRKMALDLVRQGIKTAVEAGDSRVAELNSRYGGLLDAKELLAKQSARADIAETPSVMRRVVDAIMHPKQTIVDRALSTQEGLLNKTGKIKSLTEKANVLRGLR